MKKEEYYVVTMALMAKVIDGLRQAMAMEPLETERRDLEGMINQLYQNVDILSLKVKQSDLSDEEKIANAKAKAQAIAGARASELEAESPSLPPLTSGSDDDEEEDEDEDEEDWDDEDEEEEDYDF